MASLFHGRLALCPPREEPHWDPSVVVPGLRSELLEYSACTSAPERTPVVCAVLLNALSLIDEPESQLALAVFITLAGEMAFNQTFVAAIAGIASPSSALLGALAGRLQMQTGPLQLGPDARSHVLIAAASAAASAKEPVTDQLTAGVGGSDWRDSLESIHGAVSDELSACALADASWQELHAHVESTSQLQWNEMSHEKQVAWVGHHVGMDSIALEWESKADYTRHEAYALEMLRHEHYVRHSNFSAIQEEQHTNQIVTALRAAHNLANASHAKLCLSFLTHRHMNVATAAAKALRVFEEDDVEASLLQHLQVRHFNLSLPLPTAHRSPPTAHRQPPTAHHPLITSQ